MNILPLISERLTLRTMVKEDAFDLFAYRSLPEVSKYQGWLPDDVEEAEKFILQNNQIKPGGWLQFAITLNDLGVLIGDCGIHFIDDRLKQIEIGITLSPDYQHKGYAAETVKRMLGYIFNSLEAHRVFGSCDPKNIASIRLMTRIGMRKEAHLKESIWFKGRWADDVIYALLKCEWEKKIIIKSN